MGEAATDRTVIALRGADAAGFLQGLISNDVPDASGHLVYAALLNPQGKYLIDFFVTSHDDALLIDVHADHAARLAQRLSMYRLRADVQIEATELQVQRGVDTPPAGALPDPRHPALGWRLYTDTPGTAPGIDWDALRVAHVIPETGIELLPDESYILECGFERLHGVDFKKGCYVGQEVTARMKHKTELRKGLARVAIQGDAPVGAEITANGKPVGKLFTRSGDHALCYLRFDRASGVMHAGDAELTLENNSPDT